MVKRTVLWGVLVVTCGLASAQVYEFSKPNVPVNDDSLGRHQHYTGSAGMHSLVARGDTLYATWYDNRDGSNKIYFSKSLNGGAVWNPNVIVHDTSAASHFFPAIAVSNAGELYVCWDDDREQMGRRRIYCAKSTDGGISWGRNVEVMHTSETGGHLSSICTDRNGRVLVAWGGGGKPQFSMSTDGGQSFGTNYIMDDSLFLVDPPSIGVDDSGFLYVAFASPHPTIGGPTLIWFTRSVDSGDTSFLPPIVVSDTSTSEFRNNPSLAVKPNGCIYVAYQSDGRDSLGFRRDIYLLRSTDRGRTFLPRSRVNDVNSSNLNARDPSIAVDTGSSVYVAWRDNRAGPDYGFFAVSTNRGTSFGFSVLIEDTSGSPNAYRYRHNSAVDPLTGTAYVIWSDERHAPGSAIDIYSARGTLRSGVGELTFHALTASRSHLRIQPNPFSSFASVPGYERESFALYDISGRRVGIYRGDRIGWDVSPGVYFLRAEKGDRRSFRIVKLR